METPGSKIKYALVPLAQNYIELIEPVSGALGNTLKTNGEGHIYEICFEVTDIEKFCDEMKEKGIMLVDIDGVPLKDKKFIIAPSGNKYVYLSRKNTFGTRIELLERVGKDKLHQASEARECKRRARIRVETAIRQQGFFQSDEHEMLKLTFNFEPQCH